MSKKSRKRNKKILAAIGAGLGAMALAKSRRNKAIDAGIAAADADKGSDMLASAQDYITKKTEPVLRTPPIGRMRGVGTDAQAIAGQDKRANLSNIVTDVAHPILNESRVIPGGMRRFSKGGRVTGIAKRG